MALLSPYNSITTMGWRDRSGGKGAGGNVVDILEYSVGVFFSFFF